MALYEPGGYPDDTGDLDVTDPFTDLDGTLEYGSLTFPHQCDSWTIAYGPRDDVLASIDNLISDLTDAHRRVETWER